jgi:uncharacterized protein YbjT (DUF2867 family)
VGFSNLHLESKTFPLNYHNNKMNNTAVIFGATGLVGRELVSELLENQEYSKVTIVVRRKLLPDHPKLVQIILSDFSQLMQIQDQLAASAFYCCIGTTIKIAGSQKAFRETDCEIPVRIAEMANSLSVSSLVIISSVGANAGSGNFYLRTKGEMESLVGNIFKGNLKILRPSLLMGHRVESRAGEKFAVFFMKSFGWMFIGPLRKYRGIQARDVARAMVKLASLPNNKVLYHSNEF